MEDIPRGTNGRAALLGLTLCVSLYALSLQSGRAFQLVTEQEAALPDDLMGLKRGGVTRGPDILFISPASEAAFVRSPLDLKLRFMAHGGAKIDRDSILITYRKIPPIDITQRVMPFIQADGVEIGAIELPPGVHRFRIDVKDTDGRKAVGFLVINVEK
jgi:hypothetical protein